MHEPSSQSVRTCVGTRQEHPANELVHWFMGPDGTPWPDWSGRASRHMGRGAWTLPTAEAVGAAARRGGFASAFRVPLSGLDGAVLVRRLVDAGTRGFLERLGLANRAGVLAVGQAAVSERLGTRRVGLLLIAADAGPAGRRKFLHTAEVRGIAAVTVESGAWLGQPLGREFVSVVAVEESRFAVELRVWSSWLIGLEAAAFSVSDVPHTTGESDEVAPGSGRHER